MQGCFFSSLLENKDEPIAIIAKKSNLNLTIELFGHTEGLNHYQVTHPFPIIIENYLVEINDYVKKGTSLFSIHSPELDKKINLVKNEILSTHNKFKKNILKNELNLYLKQKEHIQIVAPISGKVIDLIELFDIDLKKKIIPAGTPLALLGEKNDIIFVVSLNEFQLQQLKDSSKIKINIDSNHRKSYLGLLSHVERDPKTLFNRNDQSFLAYFKLNDHLKNIEENMTGTIQIQFWEEKNVITIPLSAIKTDGRYDLHYVDILKNNNEVEKRFVRLGKNNQLEVIVLEGINEGEKVYLSESNQ